MSGVRAIVAALVLGGCVGLGALPEDLPERPPFPPENAQYLGSQTRLLDTDLVNFLVEMRGARDGRDAGAYARCVAAGYALIRGFGFARHIRTIASQEGGLWRGDAVYTVSPALPPGKRTLDAETEVARCREDGIPLI
ncbi:hypothetical protein [Palleronia sp. THAF1]|uniref:hypothetical protein n=1 Tax=Palleronia sp. THAF1 TaxID=2587842 RepID=UPI0039B97949